MDATEPMISEQDRSTLALMLTRVSTGYYTHNIQVGVAGTWRYRFEGTGAIYAAAETSLQVTASAFASLPAGAQGALLAAGAHIVQG